MALTADAADRECAAVEEAVLAHRRSEWHRYGDLPPVTASIGVASGNVAGEGFAHLVAEADEALYRAKRAGRNQVSLVRDAA
nr:diguanylate cyclase [uncultured Sphingomonas sp.]